MPIITVVDYGLGNLFSVSRAIEHCGAEVHLTNDPEELICADKIILPGVGAFSDGMLELEKLNLIDAIRSFALSGKLLMGICLGMQMLFERGLEFGEHKGLSLLKGSVEKIPANAIDGSALKVPHIGWNSISPCSSSSWEGGLLSGISPGEFFYFVHSYAAKSVEQSSQLADTYYGGYSLPAVVSQGNIYGCQFHPEKSGPAGLRILKNFIVIANP